jgi:hypothetical protein
LRVAQRFAKQNEGAVHFALRNVGRSPMSPFLETK